jgi:O-succinylbenzoic acid--CoA ligase
LGLQLIEQFIEMILKISFQNQRPLITELTSKEYPSNPPSWIKNIFEFLEVLENSNQEIVCSTSGSTGKPTKISFKKSQMLQSALATLDFLKLEKGGNAILALPVGFIGGNMMLVRGHIAKWNIYALEPKLEIPDDPLIPDDIELLALTPPQFLQTWKNHPGLILKCKKIILGGMPVNKEILAYVAQVPKHIAIFETYGMTETLSHIALKNLSHNHSFFKVLPNVQIRLSSSNCLCIKTNYLEKEVITNDVANMAKDGKSFTILGRSDFVINSGGIKIHPEEVENLLSAYLKSPFVIIGKAHSTFGEVAILVIENAEGIDFTFLNSLFKNKLQKPKGYISVHELLYTTNGKIDRIAIKNMVSNKEATLFNS